MFRVIVSFFLACILCTGIAFAVPTTSNVTTSPTPTDGTQKKGGCDCSKCNGKDCLPGNTNCNCKDCNCPKLRHGGCPECHAD
ncbi:MAG: hypothetical protein FWD70_03285 [Desulfuromonadales bacterium]|nr:hypothetical protein [Desulfuromonadales bacterium]